MKLPLTGGCLCGALRYEIANAPSMAYTCHCTERSQKIKHAREEPHVLAKRDFYVGI